MTPSSDPKQTARNGIHSIVSKVAAEFGVPFREIYGDTRATIPTFARHVSITLAHDYFKSDLTDTEIAEVFNRKRQAVQWAVSVSRDMEKTSARFALKLKNARERCDAETAERVTA